MPIGIRTPDQRLRIFVSSTLGELIEERQSARAAIEQLRLAPVMFELGARPHPPRALYRSYLAQSDVFVGIYWQRYGWVAPEMDISGLEDELVLSTGMPRLVYVKRPAPDIEGRLADMLAGLRDEDTTSYKPFSDAAELQELLLDDLAILLAERFDGLRGPDDVAPRAAHNLPAPTSTFLGREELLRDLAAKLGAQTVRLLTLTGAAGTGKTRLALEVAADQVDVFRDGVFFVDLSAERQPDDAFAAVARTIGASVSGDDVPLDVLVQNLRTSELLFVLDNLEQVTAVGPGVAQLLQNCPSLKVLTTSREALRVRGEHVSPVPPLTLPRSSDGPHAVADALDSEAVRLFVDRAAAVSPDFALTDANAVHVADICKFVDGLPLAVELAAARVGLFSVAELRTRLTTRLDTLSVGARDLPSRQQTLRNAVEWSDELLTGDERTVFRFCSVFADALLVDVEDTARQVPELADVDMIETLGSLVDKSLVYGTQGRDGRPRFSMLKVIRTYAADQLDALPELAAGVRNAHARHYTARAIELHQQLTYADHSNQADAVSAELGNLRTAWAYWVREGDVSQLNDLLKPLWDYYQARGDYRTPTELGDELLALLAQSPDTAQRVGTECALQMSLARTRLAVHGFTPEAEHGIRAALEEAHAAGDDRQCFSALRSLASLQILRPDFASAAIVADEMLTIAERLHDLTLLSEAHLVLGVTSQWRSGLDEALGHLEKSIECFEAARVDTVPFRVGPNPGVVGNVASALMHWMAGFPDRASVRMERALHVAAELDHPYSMAYALHHAALLDFWSLDLVSAARRADELRQIAEAHDYPIWRALALVFHGAGMVGDGDVDAGLANVEAGFSLYGGLSTPPVFWPALLTIRAVTYGMAERLDEAIAFIRAADAAADPGDPGMAAIAVCWADLLLRLPAPDHAEVEALLERAASIARKREARMIELQAATGLALLRRGTPGEQAAQRELQTILDGFTEGFGTPQLVAARALLSSGQLDVRNPV